MKKHFFILTVCALAIAGRAAAQDHHAASDSSVTTAGQIASGGPAGELAKIYNAKSGEEREKAYQDIVKQFPPAPPVPGDKTGGYTSIYDYARNAVALGYARESNVPKAMQYLSLLKPGAYKVGSEGQVAYALQARNLPVEAEPLLKDAIAYAEEAMPAIKNEKELNAMKEAYAVCCNYYAAQLYKQGSYPFALKYVELARDNAKTLPANNNGLHVNILVAMNREVEAFNLIDASLRAGVVTVSMRKALETVYRKVKGETGYEAYLAKVDKQLAERQAGRTPGGMIDAPAPAFTLQDLDGNTVSLADYKGKVVMVDFWATWCGPCKASFPMMQQAVNKYKDSDNVVFLFIHTWERAGNATKEARGYIKDMKYSFRVLMDLKDQATGANPVVKSYNVTGIPTKFVIDKNGHIRFRLTGFIKGADIGSAVEDLSAMIRLAGKS